MCHIQLETAEWIFTSDCSSMPVPLDSDQLLWCKAVSLLHSLDLKQKTQILAMKLNDIPAFVKITAITSFCCKKSYIECYNIVLVKEFALIVQSITEPISNQLSENYRIICFIYAQLLQSFDIALDITIYQRWNVYI